MKIVKYLDKDQVNEPGTGDALVYTLENSSTDMKDLLRKHPVLFDKGVGLLEGKYHIRLDPSINPVQHAPRRVPAPLRQVLKNTLDDLVWQNIISPVQKPTPWLSSMVIVKWGIANMPGPAEPELGHPV